MDRPIRHRAGPTDGSLYVTLTRFHDNPCGLAVGNINGDGKSNVVIADYNSRLVILCHK
jgi:hypothetical protein